jgi:hypothetical protein
MSQIVRTDLSSEHSLITEYDGPTLHAHQTRYYYYLGYRCRTRQISPDEVHGANVRPIASHHNLIEWPERVQQLLTVGD